MTKNTAKKIAVALGTAVASSSVFAADGDTSITAAIAAGQASVELVVAGDHLSPPYLFFGGLPPIRLRVACRSFWAACVLAVGWVEGQLLS